MKRSAWLLVATLISSLMFSSIAIAGYVFSHSFYAKARYNHGWYWLIKRTDYARWGFLSSNISPGRKLGLTFDFFVGSATYKIIVPVAIYDENGRLKESANVKLRKDKKQYMKGVFMLRHSYHGKLFVVVKHPKRMLNLIGVRRASVLLHYSAGSSGRMRLPSPPVSDRLLSSFGVSGYRDNGWYWLRKDGNYARWVFRYSGRRTGRIGFYFLVTNPRNFGSGYGTGIRVYIYDRYGRLSETGNVVLYNRNPHHPYNTHGSGYTASGIYTLRKFYRDGFAVVVRWPSSNGYYFAVSKGSVFFKSRSSHGFPGVTLLPGSLAVSAHRRGEWYWIRESGNYARWGFNFGRGRVLQAGAYLYIKALVFNPYTRSAGRMTRIKIYVFDGYSRLRERAYITLYNRGGYSATGLYRLKVSYPKGMYVLVRWPSSNHYYFAVKRTSLLLKGYIR